MFLSLHRGQINYNSNRHCNSSGLKLIMDENEKILIDHVEPYHVIDQARAVQKKVTV